MVWFGRKLTKNEQYTKNMKEKLTEKKLGMIREKARFEEKKKMAKEEGKRSATPLLSRFGNAASRIGGDIGSGLAKMQKGNLYFF